MEVCLAPGAQLDGSESPTSQPLSILPGLHEHTGSAAPQSHLPALQRQPVGAVSFLPLLLWAREDSPFAMNCDPAGIPRWPRVPHPGPASLVASPFLMYLVLMELRL